MDSITVKLDSSLSYYTGKHVVNLDITQLGKTPTVEQIVDYLQIPKGMIGYIVSKNDLKSLTDTVSPQAELRLYGMYDGG